MTSSNLHKMTIDEIKQMSVFKQNLIMNDHIISFRAQSEVFNTEKATLYQLVDTDVIGTSLGDIMGNPKYGIYKWLPDRMHYISNFDKRVNKPFTITVPQSGAHLVLSAFVGYDGQKLNEIGRQEVMEKLTNYRKGVIPLQLIKALLPDPEMLEHFKKKMDANGLQCKRFPISTDV